MRILMISHEFSRSGASRMFVKLARHLYRVTVILTGWSGAAVTLANR